MSGSPVGLPDEAQGRALLKAARRELLAVFGLDLTATDKPPVAEWQGPTGGLFATLELEGELRGCIGYCRTDEPLLTLARRAVVGAAFDDPRFVRVSAEEVFRISISITVLAPPVLVNDLSEVVIGRDGLLIERGRARGLLLPQVASRRGWCAEVFVAETCRKAGLAPDAWRDGATVVQRFEAVHFEEHIDGR
ncbi:MAG TPA: AmmeMemoRadiSam system protein A [Vicinamibacteria bacterium]